MGLSPATTRHHIDVQLPAGTAPRPAGAGAATTTGALLADAFRTIVLVALAAAGILVLLPVALGSIGSGVLGAS